MNDVVHFPDKNQRNLKVCRFCTKAIGHAEAATTLRERPGDAPPSDTDKVVGHAHERCAFLQEIGRLTAACQSLETYWRNTQNLAASIVETLGGSVRIPADVPDRVAADNNRLEVVKQDDGSWKLERPSIIVNPTGAVLPPPPGSLSTR